MEAGDPLHPFPTAEWNLGAQNALEAGNEPPTFLTASGATPEGTDQAVESGPKLGSKWGREAPLGVPLEAVTPRGIRMPR